MTENQHPEDDDVVDSETAKERCPDHFVGSEDLWCHTCGWNAATLRYDRRGWIR